jgi:hypothetical protein
MNEVIAILYAVYVLSGHSQVAPALSRQTESRAVPRLEGKHGRSANYRA